MSNRALCSVFIALSFACAHTGPVHQRADQLIAESTALLARGEIEAAESKVQLALEYAPTSGDAWTNLGLVRMAQARDLEARDAFRKAVRYNPDQLQAHNNLGVLAQRARECSSARDHFEHALEVAPEFLEARYNLALTHYQCGDPVAAKSTLGLLLASDQRVADAHGLLGLIAFEEKALVTALSELARAHELAPDNAQHARNLGLALEAAGTFGEAAVIFESCIDADPQAGCQEHLRRVKEKSALR